MWITEQENICYCILPFVFSFLDILRFHWLSPTLLSVSRTSISLIPISLIISISSLETSPTRHSTSLFNCFSLLYAASLTRHWYSLFFHSLGCYQQDLLSLLQAFRLCCWAQHAFEGFPLYLHYGHDALQHQHLSSHCAVVLHYLQLPWFWYLLLLYQQHRFLCCFCRRCCSRLQRIPFYRSSHSLVVWDLSHVLHLWCGRTLSGWRNNSQC